jgi:hypothetical protein
MLASLDSGRVRSYANLAADRAVAGVVLLAAVLAESGRGVDDLDRMLEDLARDPHRADPARTRLA